MNLLLVKIDFFLKKKQLNFDLFSLTPLLRLLNRFFLYIMRKPHRNFSRRDDEQTGIQHIQQEQEFKDKEISVFCI